MWKRRIAVLCFFSAIALGQDETDLLTKYESDLKANTRSSIAHFRMAEIYYDQHNYQAAANELRDALNGDSQLRWIEVWSHIKLGKIFDITGQRGRAVNEYRRALWTKDNTRGALDDAEVYLQFHTDSRAATKIRRPQTCRAGFGTL